jgi:hypothetical protein
MKNINTRFKGHSNASSSACLCSVIEYFLITYKQKQRSSSVFQLVCNSRSLQKNNYKFGPSVGPSHWKADIKKMLRTFRAEHATVNTKDIYTAYSLHTDNATPHEIFVLHISNTSNADHVSVFFFITRNPKRKWHSRMKIIITFNTVFRIKWPVSICTVIYWSAYTHVCVRWPLFKPVT